MVQQDKLHFEKFDLNNGHVLHVQQSNLPVTFVRILIPVGNAHSHTDNLGCDEGYFHFIEHMCFERSVTYPDKKAYQEILSVTGSSFNAWTGPLITDYNFEAPAETFATTFPAFLNHIVSPVFNTDDIALQQGIIKNERLQRKYFPGEDELSHYAYTKWMNKQYYSREQLFGSDESLAAITQKKLQIVHKYYFNQPIKILVAGTFNLDTLITQLAALPTTNTEQVLQPKLHTPDWENQSFHEFTTSEIDTSIYHIGGISTHFSIERMWAVDFILHLLAHEEFGTLTNWIRHENGWSYGLEYEMDFDSNRLIWTIKIPLSTSEIASTIRKELSARIANTITNKELIAATQNRLLLQTNFDLETLSSRLDAAVMSLSFTEQVATEADYKNWLKNIVSSSYINDVYQELFSPEVIGEFLALPKGGE